PELLEKGILRNKHNLSLYKDGTIRFDATNAPLTHFKPKDIGITIESLRHLGYNKDIHNKPIENEDQIVELFIQDIILPKEAGTCLVGIANFIDDLLIHVYNQEPFYKIRKTVDLVGHMAVGLAPHTSVGVLGRIIGFTNAQVCFAHPYWQAAKRRDCDGDEDAILLLLDVLLNFSREYLPSRIGGLMDAPLLLQPLIIPAEVDEQAHNFDVDSKYSLNFYESTLKETLPDEISSEIDVVKKRLKDESHFFNLNFTHPTSTILYNKSRSTYSVLESLKLKLEKQIEIAEKINGVDPNEVVASVLRTHLVPDIVGNLRAYTSQSFKCKKCQTSYRRYPLKGTCLSCDGKLQPTISQRSVEKYLELGTGLCSKYQVGDYLRKRFELITQELRSIFPEISKAKQTNLIDFVEE
ncbi:MAG: DNA polymerase II large subunit, partial [Thaumarchaeota archaeon]|nr:DNA polymerase II large subunit [Nitrososphaerota archaeon]